MNMTEITEQELNEFFALANAELKEAESFGGEIIVHALNDLRYGSEHRVRAQAAEFEDNRLSELSKAKAHFIRAANDALKARVLFSLDRFRKFQNNFSKFADKEDLPAYLNAVNTAKEIQQYLIDVSQIDVSQRSELSNFAELKEKAHLLDSQLEKLSANRKLLINSIKKSKQRTKSFAYSSFVGLLVSIISAFMSMYLYQGGTSKGISKQITNLSNIQESLSKLQTYVTDQKGLLKNLGMDISSLKEQKAELEQVVALENDKIELVLKQYQKAQQKRRWLDILISFFVGIFSSLTVTLIFKYRKKSRETPSVDMIVNTKGKSI